MCELGSDVSSFDTYCEIDSEVLCSDLITDSDVLESVSQLVIDKNFEEIGEVLGESFLDSAPIEISERTVHSNLQARLPKMFHQTFFSSSIRLKSF